MADNEEIEQTNNEQLKDNGQQEEEQQPQQEEELNNEGNEDKNKEEGEDDLKKNSEEPSFEDPELEEMKKRFREMEEEAKKLSELQNNLESNIANVGAIDQEEIDSRSIYVGNVDYKSTHDQILAYFQSCGTVNRITILSDKTTGHPKGCCYVEFLNKESINNAMALNESMFNDRQIKITPKRTNLPYYMRGNGVGTRPFRGSRGGVRGGTAIRGQGIRGGRGGRGGSVRGHFYQPY